MATFGYTGQQRRIGVSATFADNSTVDVSRSSRLTFASSSPDVVSVDATGLLTAQGPGSAIITVSYENLGASLNVMGATGVAGDLNGDGVVNIDDLILLETMLGNAPTGPHDARDLNMDGKINELDVAVLRSLCGTPCGTASLTTSVLTATPQIVQANQSFVLSAAITTTGANSPTGNVSFVLDGQLENIGGLNGTQASVGVNSLSVGNHIAVAIYDGDTNNAPSSSAPVPIQVTGTMPTPLTVTDAGTGSGTVTSSPSGINCGTTCTANFASGTVVTLMATPGSGATFAGWSGACTGAGACSVTMSAAASVTATFNASTTYALTVTDAGTGTGTVTSSPTGINCGTTCTANFASGTMVTLTETPDSGSTFAGWSGPCTGTGACSVTMSAAASETATFNTSGVSEVSFSPAIINFGNVTLNERKKRVLTLENNGTTKVQIGAVSFTNISGNPADFSFHRYCNARGKGKLGPGRSCTIAVLFHADAAATDTATLNIVTSAPGSPLQVPITAVGINRK